MHVTVTVVAIGHLRDDRAHDLAGDLRPRSRSCFQSGQRPASIAAGEPHDQFSGLVVDGDAGQPLGMGQGTRNHCSHFVVGERGEHEQHRPRQQRTHQAHARVLRGGCDQRDPAVLHRRQQDILLGLGEPVDLVDEQDSALTAHAPDLACLLDGRPDVLHPGADRRQCDEPAPGHLRGESGQCRLPGPRWAPEDHTGGRVRITEQGPQGRRRSQQVRLPDDLIHSGRTDPGRQRLCRCVLVEQVHPAIPFRVRPRARSRPLPRRAEPA